MDLISNNILSEHFPGLAIIMDGEGKVITFNSEAHKTVQRLKKGISLFEIIEPVSAENLNKLLIEAKTYERLIKDQLTVKLGVTERDYQIVISILSNDNYLFTASPINLPKPIKELTRFTVSTKNIDEIAQEKRIVEIIDLVKASFPFTFISKNNLQRSIDNYKDLFWIKDNKGNYLIVNRNFAEFLGLKNVQVEGKNQNDFLPKYIADLNNYILGYIKETANTVILEGLYTIFNTDKERPTEVVEFPICDIDNNVVAIIGFTQTLSPTSIIKSKNEVFFESSVFNLPDAILLYDNNQCVVTSNERFNELFGFEKNKPLNGINIREIFPEAIYHEIINFSSGDRENITFKSKQNQFNIIFNLRKILDEIGNILGYGVYCQIEILQESITSDRVKMYEQILEASPEAMFIYDTENLKFLEVNNAALKLYGYSRSQFLQLDLTDLYAPEDIQTLLHSAKSGGEEKVFNGPWRHKKKDGSSILVEISKSSLIHKERKASINIIRDVTEKINENKQLQLYKASFENSGDMLIHTDKDGFIKYTNDSVVKELGYSKMELGEKTFISLLTDKDRGRINSSIFQSNLDSSVEFEIEMKKFNGESKKATLTVTPIFDFSREVESYLLVIKPEKTQERIVEVTKEIPVKTYSEKNIAGIDSEFLSNMFHEILTPINVIIGFGQELSESVENPTEEQKEASGIIRENQKMLMHLMDSVSEYISLETNKVSFDVTEIAIVDIIDDLINETQKAAKGRNIEVAYGKISSSVKFKNDKNKIVTLITEFLRFAALAAKTSKMYVSAYQYDNKNLIISVKDDKTLITVGMVNALNDLFNKDENFIRKNYGISRFSARLFKKLVLVLNCNGEEVIKAGETVEYGIIIPYEFNPNVAEDKKEMGISKPEIKKEVHMESKPEFKSEPVIQRVDSQTEYEAYIEKQNKQIAKLQDFDEEDLKYFYKSESKNEIIEEIKNIPSKPEIPEPSGFAKIEDFSESEFRLSDYNCLYVEDQVDSQILFKVQVKDIKSVDFAASLEKALPLINSKKYDFIVMDMNLQGEYNGLDALRIIRKIAGYESIPIIAATAYVMPGDKEKFILAGFNDFLSKPIMRDKLVDSVKRILVGEKSY